MFHFNKTGHPEMKVELDDYDERICTIFGVEGLGQNIGQELGLNHSNKNTYLEDQEVHDQLQDLQFNRFVIIIFFL